MEELNNQNTPGMQKPPMNPAKIGFMSLILVFILFQFGGGLLTISIVGFDLKKADPNSLRLLNTAGQLLFILLPALILAKTFYHDVTSVIRFRLTSSKNFILFTVGMGLLIPLMQSYMFIQEYIINFITKNFPFFEGIKKTLDWFNDSLEGSYSDLLTPNNFFEGILIFVVVTLVPAVCEETFFRGLVLRSFEFKYKPFIAALITAVFFGLYHFNPYGLIPLIGLALYFGFAVYITDSLAVPVLLHFINNAFALVAFMIVGPETLKTPQLNDDNLIYWQILTFIIFSVAFAGFIYYIVKNNPKKPVEEI